MKDQLENYCKRKYKILDIYPYTLISPDQKDFDKMFYDLQGIYDYSGGMIWLEFGVSSIEEVPGLAKFLRSWGKILSQYKYEEGTYFDLSRETIYYDSLDNLDMKGTFNTFAFRIKKQRFKEFWEKFIEYCLSNNYVLGDRLGLYNVWQYSRYNTLEWFRNRYEQLNGNRELAKRI